MVRVTVLVSDVAKIYKHTANVQRLRSFRNAKAKAKASAKSKAKAKRKPMKKNKLQKDAKAVAKNWPVFLPHLMLQSIYSAGLIKNLILGAYSCNVFMVLRNLFV